MQYVASGIRIEKAFWHWKDGTSRVNLVDGTLLLSELLGRCARGRLRDVVDWVDLTGNCAPGAEGEGGRGGERVVRCLREAV
jgi:hypothetical protein